MRNVENSVLALEITRRLACEKNGVCFCCEAPLSEPDCSVSHRQQTTILTSIRLPVMLDTALKEYAKGRGIKKSQALVALLYDKLIG